MSYFDLSFAFLFIPILIIIYNLMPRKARPFVLLLASFGFFFVVSSVRIIFIILSILSIYFVGIWMDKIDKKRDLLLETDDTLDKKEIKIEILKVIERVIKEVPIAIPDNMDLRDDKTNLFELGFEFIEQNIVNISLTDKGFGEFYESNRRMTPRQVYI